MAAFGIARIALADGPALAVHQRDCLVLLRDLLGARAPGSFEQALTDFDVLVDAIEAALDRPGREASAWFDPDTVHFLPPTVARPSVWCAGANYSDHVSEMGESAIAQVYHFLSPATVLNAHGCEVVRPDGVAMLDWEVELAAVIGRPTRRVCAAGALDQVAAYAISNDVSARDPDRIRHRIFGLDWLAAKNADGLTPVGPWVVPARFVPDPGDLGLRMSVNGSIRQDSRTSQMIASLPEQIAAISAAATLVPGDLLLTGTPSGTAAGHHDAYLQDGDVMVASIDGLGSLTNAVVGSGAGAGT